MAADDMEKTKYHTVENGKTNGSIEVESRVTSLRHAHFPCDLWHYAKYRKTFCAAIGSGILNFILIAIIIALSVRSQELCPAAPTPAELCNTSCPTPPASPVVSCPNGWIGYQGKCYYFSEAEGDWMANKINCSSFNASLAVIDSQEEMDFMRRYKGLADHWIGLQRDPETELWKWINGTLFNNWFEIRGGGECAYMNHINIASSSCTREEPWICSKPAGS